MARPTTDPKPHVLIMRLSRNDVRALKRLAKAWKCSRSEVLRRLLRTEAERQR
jgi:hypothetical protein